MFLTITWGSSFILIKQGIAVFTPMQVGALRLCVAGLALVFYGIRSFRDIPGTSIRWVITAGAMGNFIPMFLFPLAQEKVSSSLAGILNSLTPLFILLFGYLFFATRSRWIQVAGAAIGFAGAVILMGDNGNGGENDPVSLLIIVSATALYAMIGLVVSNYLSAIPSLKLSSVVFTIWFGPALLILFSTGFFHSFEGTPEQWKGLAYVTILGLVGTALAMILFYRLLQLTSPVFTSTVTYLMPVVAVMWGVLDGEQVGWTHVTGGLLILLGVYLIQRKSKEKRTDPVR